MKINIKKLLDLESYLPIIHLRMKIQSAVLDMMSKVKIDKSHNYTRVSDGKWLAGVTTVSGIYPKDWMAAWGAKEAVKALGYSDFRDDDEVACKKLDEIKKIDNVAEYIAMLKESKGAAFRKSKEAMINGTRGHEFIETFIKTKMRGEKSPALPDKNEMLYRPLKQFTDWADKNVKLWMLSEARVCDVDKEYAGTLDALALMNDDSLAIVDAKFASHISPEYSLQTAGYAATFEKYKIKIDKRIIVRLPKTLEKPEWNKKERKYEMIKNTIEVKEIDTPYEFDRDTFYAALPICKWINYTKKLNK